MSKIRIIAGSKRGMKLYSLEGEATRPSSDRVKEAIFNILGPSIADSQVLDLFAGSGALAIEALSRGAETAVLVDQSKAAIKVIGRNLQTTKFESHAQILNMSWERAIEEIGSKGLGFDYVFLDPPYSEFHDKLGMIVDLLEKNQLLNLASKIIYEYDKNEVDSEDLCKGLLDYNCRHYKYGRVGVTVLEKNK